jgi:thiol-disulfide isomerase/thioredoxin
MKRSCLILIGLIVTSAMFAQVLGVGDTVPNLTWTDSDGGDPVQRSLYDITSQGKYVWFDFSSAQCGPCNNEAPVLEETWQDYGAQDGDLYVLGSYFEYDWSSGSAVAVNVPWDELNGGSWRTAFEPPLTYYLSSMDDGIFQYQYDIPENPINFNVTGFPTNVIISPDNIVMIRESGFNLPHHLEHVAVINEDLGLLHPEDLAAVADETTVDLIWSFIPNSETYTFVNYTIYRNGENIIDIDDINTFSYADENLENGVYNYQISASYEKNANTNIVVESLLSDATAGILIGDLGVGEWLSYGTNFGSSSLGVSRKFAYAIEFDLGETEYIVKAIEVAHESNGEIEWAIAEYGDGLVKGSTSLDMLGNEVFPGLTGNINTLAGFVPCMSVFNCDTVISGHIAVVAIAEGNDALYAYELNNLADWFTEELEDEWHNLTYFDNGSGTFYGTWFLRIFVSEPETGIEYELTPSGLVELTGNYPNPFNPETKIQFSVSNSNDLTELNIYNVKGQKVKQLVYEQLPAGQHSVVWNGIDDNGKTVSSGIYYYKMKVGNYQQTRKMIIMK